MKNILACIIFILSFGIYLYTMVPAITGDDSGELAGVGATLGTAHPPGYPLYSIASKCVVTLVPWGNFAYRVNLVSAIFIAAACMVIFLICTQIGSLINAAAASMTFAVLAPVWDMANVTEVYGLSAFIVCLIALFIVKKPSHRNFAAIAFLSGMAFSAHYTSGLLAAGLTWWAIYNFRNDIVIKKFGTLILFVILGLSPIFFLYVRANTGPLFGWEDPKTLERFWQVVARLRYGSISLAQGGAPLLTPDIIARKLSFFIGSINEHFTLPGLLIIIVGAWQALKNKSKGWPLVLCMLGSGPGFLIMANAGLGENSRALLTRFFFLPFIFTAIFMAYGLKRMPVVLSSFALCIPVFLFFTNAHSLNHRHEYIFYDYAKNMLRTLPPNTFLFSDRADEMEFALAYMHLAERRRPDIDFVDCNAGITRSIYGDDYYRIWGKPRLAIREQTEKSIIEKAQRPVYYASFDLTIVPIKRIPEGLLFKAKPANTQTVFPFYEVYSMRIPDYDKYIGNRDRNLLLSYFYINGKYYLDNHNYSQAENYFRGFKIYK